MTEQKNAQFRNKTGTSTPGRQLQTPTSLATALLARTEVLGWGASARERPCTRAAWDKAEHWACLVKQCMEHAWEKQCARVAAARTSPMNTLLASLRMTSSQPGAAAIRRAACNTHARMERHLALGCRHTQNAADVEHMSRSSEGHGVWENPSRRSRKPGQGHKAEKGPLVGAVQGRSSS